MQAPESHHERNLRRDAQARAVLWLAVILCAVTTSWIPGATPENSCVSPGEAAAAGGWTTEVECFFAGEEPKPLRGPARLLFGETLDLNHADAAALEVLPHIGPGRAAAIVAARQHRHFTSVNDLARVPGIGPRTVAGLAGWASVETTP